MGTCGLSAAGLTRMRDVLAGYVDAGRIPGLVALVERRGETYVESLGRFGLDAGSPPMRRDAIFRVASLTKPITAAAVMLLVEECRLRLDDPIDPWLPELADRRVLTRIDAALDDTVPAERQITVRDLLTLTGGFGAVPAPPDTYPIQVTIRELRIGGDGPYRPREALDTDEWLRRLGTLPLMYQPGRRWLYDTGSDVLGVLVARVAGRPLGAFLRERLFEPLGMRDTAFFVSEGGIDRLPTSYGHDPDTGELVVYDEAADGSWSQPPPFESGGGGLVSTVDDLHAFYRMLLDRGLGGARRLLARPTVELMTMDHLTPEQRVGSEPFLDGHSGWGFGMAVRTKRTDLGAVGQFGWAGGLGTVADADPAEELVGVLLTQVMLDSPTSPTLFTDFLTTAYAAIDD